MQSSDTNIHLNLPDLTHACYTEHGEAAQRSHPERTDAKNFSNNGNILSDVEELELSSLEATVERGLRAFWEIGQALRQIRDKCLYRQKYATFENYCINRWEMSRRSGYQLIEAALVYENVRHGAQILPANERQTRPLVTLLPEQQQKAWAKAVETAPNGKITASHVAQVVKEYQHWSAGSTFKSKNTPKSQQKQSTNNSARDSLTVCATSTPGTPVEGTVLAGEGGVTPAAKTNSRSCWNCYHCSREFLDDPQSFYCYQFGKLNFTQKDGNERGAECELWTYGWSEPDQVKSRRLPLREIFTLTLHLPAHLQPLMQDAAKAEGLVVVDWAAEVLAAAVSISSSIQSETKPQGFIEVSVSDVAQDEVSADLGSTDRLSEQTAAA